MADFNKYNGRYCESDYEDTFLSLLEEEGWNYLFGNSIPRDSQREVLYKDDMEMFLSRTNPDLTADEIGQIIDTVCLVGAESDFATLHKVLRLDGKWYSIYTSRRSCKNGFAY